MSTIDHEMIAKAREILADYDAGRTPQVEGHGWLVRFASAFLSRPDPLRKRPIAWMRYVRSAGEPVQFRYRSDDGDPPEDEGWLALYRRGQPD